MKSSTLLLLLRLIPRVAYSGRGRTGISYPLSTNNIITYTSKKTLFVITALLCDLFTSIRMAVAHIHTYKVSHP